MLPPHRPFSKSLNNEDVIEVLVILEEDAMVSLKLYDMLGNEVQVLINGKTKAGKYAVPIKTSYLTRGSYFYQLKINDQIETKRIRVKN
jgi:hypothetical protein